MNALNPLGLALLTNFAYQHKDHELGDAMSAAARHYRDLPPGLLSDIRNALDTARHSKTPEKAIQNLLADLRRLFLHIESGKPSSSKLAAPLPERLKNAASLNPKEMAIKDLAVGDLKAMATLAGQLQNDPNLKFENQAVDSRAKGVTADDLKAAATGTEQLQIDPYVPVNNLTAEQMERAEWDALIDAGSFTHGQPVAEDVIASLRSFLDAQGAGKSVEQAVEHLRSNLKTFFEASPSNNAQHDAALLASLKAALKAA